MTRTLSTSDYDAARRKAASAVAEIQTYFGEVRRAMAEFWMGKSIDEIDADDAAAAAQDKARAVADFENLSVAARLRLEARIAAILAEGQEQLLEDRAVYAGMKEFLAKHHLKKRDDEIAKLKFQTEMLENTLKIVAGTRQTNDAFTASPGLPPNARSEEASRPWPDFKEKFFSYQAPGKSALESYGLAFRRLEKVVGAKAIGEIDMADIQAYRDEIEASAKPRAGRAAPSAANIQKMLSHIKTFMTWAAGDGRLIKKSPAEDVQVTPGQRQAGASESREPYSIEMLEKIFHAPLYAGCLSPGRRFKPGRVVLRDNKFWFPLVALFTGARENELQQLTPGDVRMEEGHLCFKISIIAAAGDDTYDDIEDAAKRNRLKTENAPRIIPVHPTLKKLGFLEYVERRRKNKAARLFDEFDYGKFWNQGFLPSIDIKRPGITMYSFRHTYKRALRSFQSDETKNRLMGHAPANVGELYGGGLDAKEAKLFTDFFEVPVDLSHLYPLALPVK